MGGGTPAPEPASTGKKMSQEEIEAMMAGTMGAAPQAAPAPPPAPAAAAPYAPAMAPAYNMPPGWMEMQQMQQQMLQQMQQQMLQQQQALQEIAQKAATPPKLPDQKLIQTRPAAMPRMDNGVVLDEEQTQNLNLIMSVPLEIAVEIGRTRKKVQEILALTKGSLVILDKLAGDQVDVYVNGKCIAHGDVVVIDDNFGIRISEIISKPTLEDLT